jgi:hypothetical protein
MIFFNSFLASGAFTLLCITNVALAQEQILKGVDIKQPFLTTGCESSELHRFGALGLTTKKLTATEKNHQIEISVTGQLSVCRIATDGSKKLNWEIVNPFNGFDIQYFDSESESILRRRVFIDRTKPFNKMKMIVSAEPQDSSLGFSEVTMSETADDTFSGSILIPKDDLLSIADRQKLATGQVVQKRIEIYQISNLTSFLNGQELLTGDETRSGQVVILSFQK